MLLEVTETVDGIPARHDYPGPRQRPAPGSHDLPAQMALPLDDLDPYATAASACLEARLLAIQQELALIKMSLDEILQAVASS